MKIRNKIVRFYEGCHSLVENIKFKTRKNEELIEYKIKSKLAKLEKNKYKGTIVEEKIEEVSKIAAKYFGNYLYYSDSDFDKCIRFEERLKELISTEIYNNNGCRIYNNDKEISHIILTALKNANIENLSHRIPMKVSMQINMNNVNLYKEKELKKIFERKQRVRKPYRENHLDSY